jgi:hypothetical protein
MGIRKYSKTFKNIQKLSENIQKLSGNIRKYSKIFNKLMVTGKWLNGDWGGEKIKD